MSAAAVVDGLGVGVHDIDDAAYFADPAFSHSDAKVLLASPARYRWVKDHPDERAYNAAYEFGHVVHALALGKGSEIVVVDAGDWKTKAAREERDGALAVGAYPILRAEYDEAVECAASIRSHPLAAKLLGHVDAVEVVGVWDDGDVRRKAKLDAVSGRFGVDIKTSTDASTDGFGRSAGKYAYASQDAWYRDALRACFGVDDPAFVFVVVEKFPPFLVNTIVLDPYDVELGGRRNRRAIDLYRECRDSGVWPGYGDGLNVATLPRWAEIEMEGM